MTDTPPCGAAKRDGTPCNKRVGTTPTPEGPRCFTHLPKSMRRDPASKPPVSVHRLKSAEDVARLAAWVMFRSAAGDLSAPNANAFSSAARLWLRANEDRSAKFIEVLQGLIIGWADVVEAMEEPRDPARLRRYKAAMLRMVETEKRLDEFGPPAKPPTPDERKAEVTFASWQREIDALDPDATDEGVEGDNR